MQPRLIEITTFSILNTLGKLVELAWLARAKSFSTSVNAAPTKAEKSLGTDGRVAVAVSASLPRNPEIAFLSNFFFFVS
jgi:hypothetical protein